MHKILDILLAEMTERMSGLHIAFEYTPEAKERLVGVGFDPDQGARPLRRALQKHVEDPLSEKLLRGEVRSGDQVRIDVAASGLGFEVLPGSRGEQPQPPLPAGSSA
jgi:ATP-dependent Clp protease ATP-binding subunit ClpA